MRSDETTKLATDTVSGAVCGGVITSAAAVLRGESVTNVTSISIRTF